MRKKKQKTRALISEALVPDALYREYPLDYFVGRIVKKAFTARDGRLEAMWVVIEAVREDRLVGKLDNDPLVVDHLKGGDTVAVEPAEIITVHYEKEEWLEEVRLRLPKSDFFNRVGGPARGDNFERLYEMGLGPAQALAVWRDYGHRFVG
jgi:hypothetical protein